LPFFYYKNSFAAHFYAFAAFYALSVVDGGRVSPFLSQSAGRTGFYAYADMIARASARTDSQYMVAVRHIKPRLRYLCLIYQCPEKKYILINKKQPDGTYEVL
jgi:hypothetical protein